MQPLIWQSIAWLRRHASFWIRWSRARRREIEKWKRPGRGPEPRHDSDPPRESAVTVAEVASRGIAGASLLCPRPIPRRQVLEATGRLDQCRLQLHAFERHRPNLVQHRYALPSPSVPLPGHLVS